MNYSSTTATVKPGNPVAGFSFTPHTRHNAAGLEKYTVTARVLHWLSATVILWAMVSGLGAALLPLPGGLSGFITSVNVSLTTLLVPLFLFRMIYAMCSDKPRPLDDRRSVKFAAKAAHVSLYLLTLVVLLSGILMMERDISIFGLLSVPNPVEDAVINEFFAQAHKYSCRLLSLLVVLHIAAVVRHHRGGRPVLNRMT